MGRSALFCLVCFSLRICCAQDLAPRAYLITPVQSNALTLTWSFYDGSILLDGALPITGVSATYNVPTLSYYHSFGLFGRSGNITASLPYAVGNFRGTVAGTPARSYRSGLLDSVFRFSLNLKGGPAMNAPEFTRWRQTTLMGVSLKLVAPTGQYDPSKLINWGANRWSLKPEFGYSRRWNHWLFDAYAATWFFTTNPRFFSGNALFPQVRTQSQSPIGALEGHLSYDVKPRLWFSLDGNYWFGGRTSLNGIENARTLQKNSRLGATASLPATRHQSIKISYSKGAFTRYGGDYRNISVAWQYSWIGRPN